MLQQAWRALGSECGGEGVGSIVVATVET